MVVLTLTWAVLAAPPPAGSAPGDPMPREVPEFTAASGDESSRAPRTRIRRMSPSARLNSVESTKLPTIRR